MKDLKINNDHQELLKYFNLLSYERQRYILKFIKDFYKITNDKEN